VLLTHIGIGAVIGYVTNYIAIKLLFKPYKPIKLSNITIFPQGVIPREKEALAKKVGNLVKEYILSEEEIKKIVTSDEVKKEINLFLEKKIDEFLSQDITDLIPKNEFAKNLAEFVDNLIKTKFPMFAAFVNKEQIERLFKELEIGIKLNKFVNKHRLLNKFMNEIELFLEKELPQILLKAQIDKIVEEKIISFDEKKLEDMLFSLMQKHFGFINFAGAFLGGVIGFVNYFFIIINA
jgi:uncharacterized membrane protein YheB (UPF0754 family)